QTYTRCLHYALPICSSRMRRQTNGSTASGASPGTCHKCEYVVIGSGNLHEKGEPAMNGVPTTHWIAVAIIALYGLVSVVGGNLGYLRAESVPCLVPGGIAVLRRASYTAGCVSGT